ncbi:unnamed protein product [Sympodiomycopsis kandeliae]
MASAIHKLFARRKAKHATKQRDDDGDHNRTDTRRESNKGPRQTGTNVVISEHGRIQPSASSYTSTSQPSSAKLTSAQPTTTNANASNSLPFPKNSTSIEQDHSDRRHTSRTSLDAATLLASTTSWFGKARERLTSSSSAPMLDLYTQTPRHLDATAPGAAVLTSSKASFLQHSQQIHTPSSNLEGYLDHDNYADQDAASLQSTESDPTDSVVYQQLSQSSIASSPSLERLRAAFNEASIVVVPTNAAISDLREETTAQLLNDQYWLALHLFAPSRLFTDQYRSISPDHCAVASEKQSQDPAAAPSSQWRGFSAALTIDDDSGEACIDVRSLNDAIKARYILSIASDTTVYSSMAPGNATEPARDRGFQVISRPQRHRSVSRKLRLIAVQGLPFEPANIFSGNHSTAKEEPSASAEKHGEQQQKEDRAAMPPPSSSIELKANDNAGMSSVKVPISRSFFRDLEYLIAPSHLQPALSNALNVLLTRCRELEERFVIVAQFQEQNRNKLREGILRPAQQCLQEQLASSDSLKLLNKDGIASLNQILENVMMGYLFKKIFASVASHDRLASADQTMDAILPCYQDVRLDQFGVSHQSFVSTPARLSFASAVLKSIDLTQGADYQGALVATILDDPRALRDQVHKLAQGHNAGVQSDMNWLLMASTDGDSDAFQPSYHGILTPLDLSDVLRRTLNAIQEAHKQMFDVTSRAHLHSALDKSSSGANSPSSPVLVHGQDSFEPLSTDELLPILAYVLVQSGVSHFPSLLAYMRAYRDLFTGKEATTPRTDAGEWALVTFEAVCKWLMTDPLGLLGRSDLLLSSRRTSEISEAPSTALSTSETPDRSLSTSPTLNSAVRQRDRRKSLPSTTLLSLRPTLPSTHSYRLDSSSDSPYVARGDRFSAPRSVKGRTMATFLSQPGSTSGTKPTSRSSSLSRRSPEAVGLTSAVATHSPISTTSSQSSEGGGDPYLSFGALRNGRRHSNMFDYGGETSKLLLTAPVDMSRQVSRASTAASFSSRSSSSTNNELTIRKQIQVHTRPSARNVYAVESRVDSPASANRPASTSTGGPHNLGHASSATTLGRASTTPHPGLPRSPMVRVMGSPSADGASKLGSQFGTSSSSSHTLRRNDVKMVRTESEGANGRGRPLTLSTAGRRTPTYQGHAHQASPTSMARRNSLDAVSMLAAGVSNRTGNSMDVERSASTQSRRGNTTISSWLPQWLSSQDQAVQEDAQVGMTTSPGFISPLSNTSEHSNPAMLPSPADSMIRSPSGSEFATTISEASGMSLSPDKDVSGGLPLRSDVGVQEPETPTAMTGFGDCSTPKLPTDESKRAMSSEVPRAKGKQSSGRRVRHTSLLSSAKAPLRSPAAAPLLAVQDVSLPFGNLSMQEGCASRLDPTKEEKPETKLSSDFELDEQQGYFSSLVLSKLNPPASGRAE